jgi:hypothetical protein
MNDHAVMNVGRSRSGTLVVCVLVCLLVASSLAAASTHAALQWRRSMTMEQQLRQTELLLDAGILRAARQLQKSPGFRGEVWRPEPSSVRFESPVVEIRITTADDPEVRLVDVIAQLGTAPETVDATGGSPRFPHTRRSHSFSFRVTDQPENSDSPSVE